MVLDVVRSYIPPFFLHPSAVFRHVATQRPRVNTDEPLTSAALCEPPQTSAPEPTAAETLELPQAHGPTIPAELLDSCLAATDDDDEAFGETLDALVAAETRR